MDTGRRRSTSAHPGSSSIADRLVVYLRAGTVLDLIPDRSASELLDETEMGTLLHTG